MRVLIIKTSSLAEILHSLPVLDFLHAAVPGIEIDWVIDERFAETLAGNPRVRRLFTVKQRPWRRDLFSLSSWRELSALKNELAAGRYNIVFDLQGDLQSGLLSKYTGCGRRYGLDADNVRDAANLRFSTNQVPLRKQDFHETDRLLRIVSVPFGRDYSGTKLSADFVISHEEDQAAELLFSTLLDGLVFMFCPAAAFESMQWSEAGWIELGKSLILLFPDSTVIIPWSDAKERVAAENIARGIGRHVKLIQQPAFMGFTAILKKVDLVLGGDAAPVHLAAAINTPTVSFYRSTDGRRSGPRGENHRIIQSPLSCTKCFKQSCDQDVSCRESIAVKELLGAAVELLEAPWPRCG